MESGDNVLQCKKKKKKKKRKLLHDPDFGILQVICKAWKAKLVVAQNTTYHLVHIMIHTVQTTEYDTTVLSTYSSFFIDLGTICISASHASRNISVHKFTISLWESECTPLYRHCTTIILFPND